MQAEQRGDDGLWLAARCELGLQRPVAGTFAAHGVHYLPARQVNDGDQFHGMRVFVYEHVTGGGFAGEALPASLASEGELMLRALLDDLRDVPGTEVLLLRDARLPPLDPSMQALRPHSPQEADALFRRSCLAADAVWPIAPETGGTLERLSSQALDCGRVLLGCRPEAVRIAASKTMTARALARAGVPVAPAYNDAAQLPAHIVEVVIKPDDGAGCLDTRLHDRASALEWWRRNDHRNHVLQPYLRGEALSLSLLCDGRSVHLLTCNRQHIAIEEGVFHFKGVSVNAVRGDRERYARLGRHIAAAIPGLWGYVGVDLIETEQGAVVLEVNPRLTTSYVGLRRALACNPARLVLALLEPVSMDFEAPDDAAVNVETCYG